MEVPSLFLRLDIEDNERSEVNLIVLIGIV